MVGTGSREVRSANEHYEQNLRVDWSIDELERREEERKLEVVGKEEDGEKERVKRVK